MITVFLRAGGLFGILPAVIGVPVLNAGLGADAGAEGPAPAMLIGAALIAVAILMMLRSFVIARTALALADSGTPASATVQHVRRIWPISQIVYTYRDAKDTERRGTSFRRFTSAHRTLEPNDYLTVFYDPDRPGRSFWKNDLRQEH